MKSVGTIVTVFFIASALLLWIVLDAAFTSIWAMAGWINAPILGAQFTYTTAGALAISVVAGFVCWRHKTLNALSREVVQELKKVSWPNWMETKANTIVVIVFSFIMAAILGVFDYVFALASDGFFKTSGLG